jgi:hypothetical protein
MGVGKNEMKGLSIFSYQLIPEAPDTCTRVNDDNIIAFCADFNAGGVATVFEILFAGNWYRSSGPPTLNYHWTTYSLNKCSGLVFISYPKRWQSCRK